MITEALNFLYTYSYNNNNYFIFNLMLDEFLENVLFFLKSPENEY